MIDTCCNVQQQVSSSRKQQKSYTRILQYYNNNNNNSNYSNKIIKFEMPISQQFVHWKVILFILLVLLVLETKANIIQQQQQSLLLYDNENDNTYIEQQAISNTTVNVNRIHQLHDEQQQQQQQQQRRRLTTNDNNNNNENTKKKNRVLYIITALSEYNTGTRSTIRGSDRLQETFIPVVSEGVRSMIQHGYNVDVYLVAHFTLLPNRMKLIIDSLPNNVGFDVWNNATPIGYDTSSNKSNRKLENRTLHLSRQHRFIIKEKLLYYDIFINYEDDMLITGHHIDHYVAVTNELRRLEDLAPIEVSPTTITSKENALRHYYGTMTKGQLRRMIPGFMRVEVLTDETNYPAQSSTGPIPIDLQFTSASDNNNDNQPQYQTVNPESCCYISDHISNVNRPSQPLSDQLMIWETNILPLGIRQMPKSSWLQWVVLQRGPNQNELNYTNEIIGDYWCNRNYDYYGIKQKRPQPHEFKYINNMGGWMATREQLWRWHTEICPGGFLPPYEKPHYNYDGLDMRNVEWYSGGMQLSTIRHACNMQRIMLLDPTNFSKSLLYHTANNKQRQLTDKREEAFTKANTLLGQLNTIKKRAEKEIP